MQSISNLLARAVKRLRGGASYHEVTVDDAEKYCRIKGKRVLVVGANTGEDCALFARRGAAEIHGLDVIDNVGCNFSHPDAIFHRQSIEATTLPSDHFDLVFAMATMEHVPNIAAGFAEMARLVRPGGAVYSSAAPLWESPYGHHMGCFDEHPWVHLLFDQPDLADYARAHGIEGERGHSIDGITRYMLDPSFFNKVPAEAYLSACEDLDGLTILENKLYSDDGVSLDHPLGRRALAAGFSPTSLLATRHKFVALKPL